MIPADGTSVTAAALQPRAMEPGGPQAGRPQTGTPAEAPPTGTRPGARPTGTQPAARQPGSGTAGLLFVAEMYGVQIDQLAAVLGITSGSATAAVARWRRQQLADSARLGPGPRWVWLTRTGLASCGLPYIAATPALARLAHIRAVTAVRLALEQAPQYPAAGAYWRSERRLRARMGGRTGIREHVPDGEVHWPDGAPVPWAGECWAIEAELTPKTVTRTAAIMRELLARTGDYGCAAADVQVRTRPPRHARAIYVCAPAARPVVSRARDAIGPGAARIEIRDLPRSAAFPAPARAARDG